MNSSEEKLTNIVVVLENPNFIINIGHVIRNANALGIENVFVVDGQKRLENTWEEIKQRKSLIKHSSSAVKWTKVNRFNNSEECIHYLEEQKFLSYVTSPHLKSKNNIHLDQLQLDKQKIAIWFGNESKGISNYVVNNCKQCINIEMYGEVESFNLASTTAIVLYKITQQLRNNF